MFLDYRIRKLQAKIDIQKGITDILEVTHKEYRSFYYADRFIESYIEWLNLNSKLKCLKDKKAEMFKQGEVK